MWGSGAAACCRVRRRSSSGNTFERCTALRLVGVQGYEGHLQLLADASMRATTMS